MRKIIILTLIICVAAGIQMQTHGQSQRQRRARTQTTETRETLTHDSASREMKIIVRDTLGNRLNNVTVAASFRGRSGLFVAETDAAGDRFFRVTDADTLDLMVYNMLFEIAAEGTDSLVIVSRLETRASGVEAINDIDPVTVTAQRQERTNVGYGSLLASQLVGMSTVVDMSRAHLSPDIITFLRGNLGAGAVVSPEGFITLPGCGGAALLVVDGVTYRPELKEAFFDLTVLQPSQIASIYIDKLGSMYGARGANGVVVITTKTGNR